MDTEQRKSAARELGIINLVLALWLIISPFTLGYPSGAIANSVILGIVVAILAIIRLSAPNQTWASWLNGVAGLWLILAPFMFGFTTMAVLWNELIIGVIVTILGFWNGTVTIPMRHATHHHSM